MTSRKRTREPLAPTTRQTHAALLVELPVDLLRVVLYGYMDPLSIVMLRRCCRLLHGALAVPVAPRLLRHSIGAASEIVYQATMEKYGEDDKEEERQDRKKYELLLLAMQCQPKEHKLLKELSKQVSYQMLKGHHHFPTSCMQLGTVDFLVRDVWTGIHAFGPQAGMLFHDYKQEMIDEIVKAAIQWNAVAVLQFLWDQDLHIKRSVVPVYMWMPGLAPTHEAALVWLHQRRLADPVRFQTFEPID